MSSNVSTNFSLKIEWSFQTTDIFYVKIDILFLLIIFGSINTYTSIYIVTSKEYEQELEQSNEENQKRVDELEIENG